MRGEKMLPIGDENTGPRSTPIVTYIFLALNIIMYVIQISSPESFTERWAFVPARFRADPAGEFITIFTSMFMHGSLLHIGSNMLYLWIFGDNVENRFGPLKFLIFYLLTGVAAVFAQMLVNPSSNIPLVGASGAISGVLGAYILLFPQGRVRVLLGRGIVALPALVVIGFWIVLQLFSGFGSLTEAGDVGGVAYWAHIGGFAAGLLLTFLFKGSGNPRLSAGR
jgi:membrane associated rhomboid family serine protease